MGVFGLLPGTPRTKAVLLAQESGSGQIFNRLKVSGYQDWVKRKRSGRCRQVRCNHWYGRFGRNRFKVITTAQNKSPRVERRRNMMTAHRIASERRWRGRRPA